jgi:hypothetical protein
MNGGLARVDGRLHVGTSAGLRAATCVAAELLRAESQLETLAAGAHADVIVLDGYPLEDIGLPADPAAHMPLVIPGRCRRPAALTRGPVQLPRPSSDIRVIISANQTEKLAKITRISPVMSDRALLENLIPMRAIRRVGACSLGPAPSLSVQSLKPAAGFPSNRGDSVIRILFLLPVLR